MNKAPLYQALKEYKKNNIYPFHMPGHKQGRLYQIEDIMNIDLTEVNGTDNLHHPKSVIKEAQQFAANTFGAERTFFLVNGSTVGIMAAIASICKPEEELIVARNCHRSVYDAMITVGINPHYIMPEIIKNKGIIGGINPQVVESALIKNNNAKGVIITSPTYEGFTSNIKKIAEVVHKHNKILIVDEAHGAHFKFNQVFPMTALQAGVDIVIQSIHKTLPAFTQSAMLHIQGNRVNPEIIQSRLALYETSSPSYILMAGLDYCRYILDTEGNKLFSQYVKLLTDAREQLGKLKNIEILGKDLKDKYSINDIDISKLVLYCGKSNVLGTKIEYILRKQYNIQVELSGVNHILAMTSIADNRNGFEMLVNALLTIDSKLKKKDEIDDKYDIIKLGKVVKKPRDAYFAVKKYVSIDESINKISGEFIIPYPPGIPLIVPGEKISIEVINKIRYLKQDEVQILGLKDETGEKIQILEV